MTRIRVSFFIVLVLFGGCASEMQQAEISSNIGMFEMSYTNGWGKNFSCVVDSNKIYLIAVKPDTIYYGILPDSIFVLLDSCFLKIKANSHIRSHDSGCVDCSIVAVKFVSKKKGDTIHINQTGDINTNFQPVIYAMQNLIERGVHSRINSTMFLETQRIILPLPPKVDMKKFNPPKVK